MSDLKDFWVEQAKWSNEVFGDEKFRGPMGPLKHLKKEVEEALFSYYEAINGVNDGREHLKMELVDCQFLVFDAARRAGLSYDELVSLCFAKLEINKKRTRGSANPTEAVEHVREATVVRSNNYAGAMYHPHGLDTLKTNTKTLEVVVHNHEYDPSCIETNGIGACMPWIR